MQSTRIRVINAPSEGSADNSPENDAAETEEMFEVEAILDERIGRTGQHEYRALPLRSAQQSSADSAYSRAMGRLRWRRHLYASSSLLVVADKSHAVRCSGEPAENLE